MTLETLIALAFGETMPRGDLIAAHLPVRREDTNATLTAAEDLVLAGCAAFEAAVRFRDPNATFNWQFDEGDLVLRDQVACWVRGNVGALLATERIAVNLIGRACGIATLTKCYVNEVRGTGARVVHARCAAPGLRDFDFEAVRAGGGFPPGGANTDALYVTLNHARAAGSLARALQLVRAEYTGDLTTECASAADARAAVAARASRLVLMGLDAADLTTVRTLAPTTLSLEAGGTLSLSGARALAEAGVDFVRVEQLTAGAPRAELEFNVVTETKP